MVCHSLDLDNHCLESIDDIKVAFTPCTWIPIVQFIPPSQFIFISILLPDLTISHAFHIASIEFVKHSHLLDIVLLLIEGLPSGYTPLQHGGPNAKVLFHRLGRPSIYRCSVLRIWGSGVARQW